jgi:hypothetical protein
MALAIPTAPIVAPDAGANLADHWAERIALQWVDALRAEAVDVRVMLAEFLQIHPCPGNIIAQRKWAARLRRAFGDRVLQFLLQPGNRGRFSCALDILAVGAPIGAQPRSAEPVFTWLAGLRVSFSRCGPKKSIEKDIDTVAALSKHCLSRLVQRAGCCSAIDLHAALVAAWPRISIAEALTRTMRAGTRGASWLLPVTIPTAAEPVIFAMSGPGMHDDGDAFFAKTVFPLSFFNAAERRAVLALHRFLDETDLEDIFAERRAEAEALLAAVRSEAK